MDAHDAAPRTGIQGSGKIIEGAAILPFCARRRECADCTIHLPPTTPSHHTLCRTCYHWRRIGRSVASLAASLREVRR